MISRFLITTFFILSEIIVFGQSPRDISKLFSKAPLQNERAVDHAYDALTLELNESLLSEIYREKNENIIMTLLISENESVTLDLHQFKVLNDNFILRTSSGDTVKNYKPGLFYRGKIRGKEGIVTISIFKNELMGIISIKDQGNFNVSKIKDAGNQYIIYNDFKSRVPRSFECHTPDTPLDKDHRHEGKVVEVRTTDCVKFYLEGDYELFQEKGSVANATNYMTALFAEVAELYLNEEISIEISETMVWNTPDNYTNSGSDVDLDIFIDNNPNFNGDLASLLSLGGGEEGLGGLAYVDVLCSQYWAYSYCGIIGGFNNVPSYSWDVEVCAHEWGHNFGSRHTHACVWNGNNTQIDDCGNKYAYDNGETPEGNACFNPNNPILPSDGTIMSYCHLIGGVGINFSLGFGPQPGNLLRNRYNAAGCLTACTGGGGNSPVAEFSGDPLVICEGQTVFFLDESTGNPTELNWTFPGGTPGTSDIAEPSVVYEFTGVYDVTLVATNSNGSDTNTKYEYITVNKVAEPSFTYTVLNYKQVTFSNQSQFATDYYWDFGDGTTSSESDPVHLYDIDGSYTVTLFASNANCTEYQLYVDYIEIISPPVANFNFNQTDFCKPSTIQFNDASSYNVSSRLWEFEGGNPATSTAINPVVLYDNVGLFNVKLTVYNELYNNTKVLIDTVKIYTTPVADFQYVVSGNVVTFTNSTLNGVSYLWNFGDNTTSTTISPVHTYTSGGTFEVVLTATNICGNNSKTKTITISAEPNAEFSADAVSGCSPFSTVFHNLSNTTNVSWVFEAGVPATSTQQNPIVNYLNPGQYKVTLYATNSLGSDTLIRDDYIQVLALPSGSFTNTVSGYTASFTQATNNVSGFFWKFGDGSQSTQVNPNHTYQHDGNYLVEFVYYNNCDTLTFTKNVIIANPPVANFTQSVVTGCKPLSVTFTNTSSSNASTFLWTFEGGTPATSTLNNPVVTFNNKGSFNVSLKATNSVGSNTKTQTDLINVTGVAIPAFTHTNNGLNYSFTYTGEPANQIKWLFGDGASALGQQVNHVYASTGSYALKVISTNNCGSDTLSYTLVVALFPSASFTFNTDEGCAPLEVQYSNTSTSSNSVFWMFEGGIPSFSTANNPNVVYTVGGKYDVQLIAFGNQGNDTLNQESIITVDAGPSVNFNFAVNGATVNFTSLCSADADEFFWDFGDGSVSTEKDPKHTYLANGNYTVSLFANNDCGQQSKSKTVLMTTVKTSDLVLNGFSLYPNPNDGNFNIDFETIENGDYNIRIYNSTGKVINTSTRYLEAGSNSIDFSFNELPQGLYLLKIAKDLKSYQVLFSKQ